MKAELMLEETCTASSRHDCLSIFLNYRLRLNLLVIKSTFDIKVHIIPALCIPLIIVIIIIIKPKLKLLLISNLN